MVLVEVMFEVLKRSFGKDFDEKVMKKFADEFGEARCPEQSIEWMRELKEECDLIDSFLHFHEEAEDRFTCFDQYKNHRYVNKGSRIDFILTHKSFPLALGAPLPLVNVDARAALACVTAEGRWRPAPMDGSGLDSGSGKGAYDWEFHCSDPPRTGIIYTPPSFSDHLAVTALIDLEVSRSSDSPTDTRIWSAYENECHERMKKHLLFSGKVAVVSPDGTKRQQTLTGMFASKRKNADPPHSDAKRVNASDGSARVSET
jgi:hypothetical protein